MNIPKAMTKSQVEAGAKIDHGLDLAVIGNCKTAALVDPTSRLVWWCFPRFDAAPVFSRLLAGDEEKGFSDVVLDGMVDYKSDYVRNTALVETILTDGKGNAVRITDFAPRFRSTAACSGRHNCFASLSRLPDCRVSPFAFVPHTLTASR